MLPFAVVEFISSKTVDIIPVNWFTGEEEDMCYWPSSNSNATKMAMNRIAHSAKWKRFSVRVLGKAGNYERVREKLALAEETSDLQTDVEEPKRKKRGTRKYVDSSTDEGEEGGNGSETERPTCTHLSRSLERPPTPPQDTYNERPNSPRSPTPPPVQSQTPSPSTSYVQPTSSGISPQRSISVPAAGTPSGSSSGPLITSTPTGDKTSQTKSVLEKIFHILEEIKQTQKIQGSTLQSLVRRSTGHEEVELPDEAQLPVTTVEEFEEFNNCLKDAPFQQRVVVVLGDIGGRTLDEAVKRTMRFLMTNEVALKYNFTGKDKKSFAETRAWETVYRAIKRNTQVVCDRKQVSSAVGKWLTGARDRNGGRAAREKRDKERRDQERGAQGQREGGQDESIH